MNLTGFMGNVTALIFVALILIGFTLLILAYVSMIIGILVVMKEGLKKLLQPRK